MRYPALDVRHGDSGLMLAVVDDYSPTAVEERDGVLTIFFSDRPRRDHARDAIAHAWPLTVTTPREVDDEDWARRSQQNLKPITIGRITLFPDPEAPISLPRSPAPHPGRPLPDSRPPIAIVIAPSMGFGTGHHATTRLCLAALQTLDLAGAFVVDVGSGSGVLAIAARLLGADRAVGIDNDPDAVQAAQRNLSVNPAVDAVVFEEADLASWLPASPLPPLTHEGRKLLAAPKVDLLARERRTVLAAPTLDLPVPERRQADVVTANLTGALLVREAASLVATVLPGGSLIVSGLLADEHRDVVAAFERAGDLRVVWQSQEEEWVGLMFG